MILLSKYDNYELIFMHNGRAIKFNSSSLQEIKDVNQILIDISYDFKRLRNVRRYKVNGRYYNLRYNNGVLKILDSYDKRQNRYFMSDNVDINVVDNEKLNSKLIFEDSDDYLDRNESRQVVLNNNQDMNRSSRSLRAPEIGRTSKKDSMRHDDENAVLNNQTRFFSRGEVDSSEDNMDYLDDLHNDSSIIAERDSKKSYDMEDRYYHKDMLRMEAPVLERPSRYSNDYPQNINMPGQKSNTVFRSSIADEDPATRDKIIKLSSYVNSSSHRSLVLNDINTSIKTPKTIATGTGLRPNYVSKVLKDFKVEGIVVCINEEARKGKLYELTELGLKIFDYLRGV